MPVIGVSHDENYACMKRGELYHAFTPELLTMRDRAYHACHRFNAEGEAPRRRLVELWRDVVDDKTPLPPVEEGDANLDDEPYVMSPVRVDYGTHLKFGKNVFINFNSVFVDTCDITIGSRTLVGPNVSFFSGTHPLDPFLRNGTRGPELGKPITVGEDCWIGGNAIILPGVTLGRGVVVGAGSVVTKNVPAFHAVAGNPARILRKIEPESPDPLLEANGAEVLMAEQARRLEAQDGPEI